MRRARMPRLLGVRKYLNNYCAKYKRLTFPVYAKTLHPRLLGVRNYLNNYFAMCTRVMRSRIRVDLAFAALLGLELLK